MLSLLFVAPLAFCTTPDDWPGLRGPRGEGRSTGPAVASSWSSDQNLQWRTALPGKGSSSPIVVGDRVYLTCYTGYGVDPENVGNPADLVRHLLAFDRSTGEELWRASVPGTKQEDPYQGFLTQHGYASSTPVADEDHVFVLFGKSGLHAYTTEGELIWQCDLGQLSDPAKWGDGSSPILMGDMIIVDAGVLGHQVVGVHKDTGEITWSKRDKGFTNGWATPTPLREPAGAVVFNTPGRVFAMDAATGTELWSAESPLKDATCGSVVVDGRRAFLMGSRAGRGMALTMPDPKGPDPQSGERAEILWRQNLRSGICTPLVVGEGLYWCTGGIFFGASLDTGEYLFRERLPLIGEASGFPNGDYSSPIAVGDTIIQFTRSGESYLIEAGDSWKLLAHNPPFEGDESAFSATPAVADGQLFVRSESYLYCIAEQ